MKPNDKVFIICVILVIYVILQAQCIITHKVTADTQRHQRDIDSIISDMTKLTDVQAFKREIQEYVRNELEGYRLNDEMNRQYYKELIGR